MRAFKISPNLTSKSNYIKPHSMNKVVTFALSLFLTFTFINSATSQQLKNPTQTQKILKFRPASSDAEKKLYHINIIKYYG